VLEAAGLWRSRPCSHLTLTAAARRSATRDVLLPSSRAVCSMCIRGCLDYSSSTNSKQQCPSCRADVHPERLTRAPDALRQAAAAFPRAITRVRELELQALQQSRRRSRAGSGDGDEQSEEHSLGTAPGHGDDDLLPSRPRTRQSSREKPEAGHGAGTSSKRPRVEPAPEPGPAAGRQAAVAPQLKPGTGLCPVCTVAQPQASLTQHVELCLVRSAARGLAGGGLPAAAARWATRSGGHTIPWEYGLEGGIPRTGGCRSLAEPRRARRQQAAAAAAAGCASRPPRTSTRSRGPSASRCCRTWACPRTAISRCVEEGGVVWGCARRPARPVPHGPNACRVYPHLRGAARVRTRGRAAPKDLVSD
jgi:hypothetical protein